MKLVWSNPNPKPSRKKLRAALKVIACQPKRAA